MKSMRGAREYELEVDVRRGRSGSKRMWERMGYWKSDRILRVVTLPLSANKVNGKSCITCPGPFTLHLSLVHF